MVSVKLKKANAATHVEYFNTLPAWEGLTLRIAERFHIPLRYIAVGYIDDDAGNPVVLTDDEGLQEYYKSFHQPSEIKFVVLHRHTPDPRTTIISSWISDSDLYERANTVSLFCWVLSTAETESFSVVIGRDKTVDSLKKKMKTDQGHTFAGIDSNAFRLWKLFPPIPASDKEKLRHVESPEEVPACVQLNPTDAIGLHFLSPPLGHIHIIVHLPTPSGKRTRSPEEAHASKKICNRNDRKWYVNGAIYGLFKDLSYFLDPAERKQNKIIMNSIRDHQFLLVLGPRSSGKSTQLLRVRELVENLGYHCFYFTFERVDYSQDTHTFWSSVGRALHCTSKMPILLSISSPASFIDAFAVSEWDGPVVLLIDELSEMLDAPDKIRDEFLRTLRAIRHSERESAIKSVIGAGIFGTIRLTTSKSSISPFSISNSVQMAFFSRDETRKIFGMFAADNDIHLDDAVIDAIWAKSNGHPGMVCVCGKVVSENVEYLLDRQSKTISYANWVKFSMRRLSTEITAYNSFRSIVKFLRSPQARGPLQLFRTSFAGFLGAVQIPDQDEEHADFLTSAGVLSRPNMGALTYQVTSAYVDELVRLRVIPALFTNAPTISPLQFHPKSLLIPRVLRESLKYFDKDVMQLARSRSYKLATVPVQGYSHVPVPRESVYGTELLRILCNWLKPHGWYITGQWHSKTSNSRQNLVLQRLDDTIVLELLATEETNFIKDHITKIPEYMSLLSANEAWVIHFTCEDSFTPIWQTSAQLAAGLNVIHLVHDVDFTQMVIHICWCDGNGVVKKDS